MKHAAESHRPILVTSHGRGIAVVQSLSHYEKAEEEQSFMRAVTAGLVDLEKGRALSLDDVKKRLGIR